MFPVIVLAAGAVLARTVPHQSTRPPCPSPLGYGPVRADRPRPRGGHHPAVPAAAGSTTCWGTWPASCWRRRYPPTGRCTSSITRRPIRTTTRTEFSGRGKVCSLRRARPVSRLHTRAARIWGPLRSSTCWPRTAVHSGGCGGDMLPSRPIREWSVRQPIDRRGSAPEHPHLHGTYGPAVERNTYDTWQVVLPGWLSVWLLHCVSPGHHIRPRLQWYELPGLRVELSERPGLPLKRVTLPQFFYEVFLARS